MSDALTYHAALQLLPRGKSRLLSVLNAAETAGLAWRPSSASAAAEATDAPMSISELRDEIVEFTRDTLRGTSEWRTGVSRFTRSQRLSAVHAVLVLSSFFDALTESVPPVPLERLDAGHDAAAVQGEVPD